MLNQGKTIASLVALATFCSLGCFAHRAGTPLDIEPVGELPDRDRKLVVGVREPEVKLDPPIVEGAKSEPWTTLGELNRSLSLIRSMRASGLFREVDFEGQLKCAPDVVVEANENPRLTTCDADAPMLLLYLGIIPVWYTCDSGHYFSRAEEDDHPFEFPWHDTLLFGWFPPLLNLFPGWTWKPPPPAQREESFRAFLLSIEPELLAGIEPQGRSACPRR